MPYVRPPIPTIPGIPSARITLEGGLDNFNKFFNHATSKKLQRDIKYSFRDFLRSYRLWAIKGLLTAGTAVGESWENRSIDDGLPGIRTGNYLEAIQSMKISMKGDSVTMNFRTSDLSSKSHSRGLTMQTYIEIFEHGSIMQPARPLWAPAWNKAGGLPTINRLAMGYFKRSFKGKGLNNININIRTKSII